MSVQVSYKKQITLGLMFLVIIFLVVEGVAKAWWFQIESCGFEDSDVYANVNPEMKRQMCVDSYQLQISDELIEPLQELDTININSFGFRGKEISLEKPDNTYRIFAVGGSTMLGTGSTSDVTTIPGYLQEKFDDMELTFEIEIINAGISGAWSKTETSLIKTKLIDFQPDMIIAYDGWNDSSNFAGWSENNENADEIATKWLARWNEICDIGKDEGFKTIIILQPILGTSERILSGNEYAIFSEIKDDKVQKRLEMLGNVLGDLSASCTMKLDFRNAFDGIDQPIFWDRGHLGNAGNNIIAEKMVLSIYPLVTNTKIKLLEMESKTIDSEIESAGSKDMLVQSKRFILKNFKTPLLVNHFLSFNQNQLVTQIGTDKEEIKTISDIDFSKKLEESNFQRFYLPKSNFSEMNLEKSNFSNSYLKNSNFEKAILSESKFIHANMRGSDLSNTKSNNVDFSHSDLTGADISNSHLIDAKFVNSYVYNTNLRNSDLSNVDFTLTNILGVDFQYSNLNNVKLIGQDLRRSFLMNSDLTNANLQGAFIETTYIKNATLIGTNFSDATFTVSDFEGFNLTKTNFSNSILINGNFKNTILTQTDFNKSDLTNVDFSNSNLEDAIGGPFIGCMNHHLCE
ncbi:pentapeptide repeat-containing protein [Candidatus Nitrosopelagicus sp.]|nr:pentapeptide repeat-containing protein [Candidatus Nitrosopelagicus sp.]